MKDKSSHQYSKKKKLVHISIAKKKKLKENNQNNKARVQVTLDTEKKPQALTTPSDFFRVHC